MKNKKIYTLFIILTSIIFTACSSNSVILSNNSDGEIVEKLEITSENILKSTEENLEYDLRKGYYSDYDLNLNDKQLVEDVVLNYNSLFDAFESPKDYLNNKEDYQSEMIKEIKKIPASKNFSESMIKAYLKTIEKDIEVLNDTNFKGSFDFKVLYNDAIINDKGVVHIPTYQYVKVNSIDYIDIDKYYDDVIRSSEAYKNTNNLEEQTIVEDMNRNKFNNRFRKYKDAEGKHLILSKGFIVYKENILEETITVPSLITSNPIKMSVFNAESLENYNEWAHPYVYDLMNADILELRDVQLSNSPYRSGNRTITRIEFTKLMVKLYEEKFGTIDIKGKQNPFTDTTDVYAKKSYYANLIKGIEKDKFAPNLVLTREQSATVISRLLNLDVNGQLKNELALEYNPSRYLRYDDHNEISSWALEHAKYLNAKEIMEGYSNKFHGKDELTIAQSITLISRTKNYIKY